MVGTMYHDEVAIRGCRTDDCWHRRIRLEGEISKEITKFLKRAERKTKSIRDRTGSGRSRKRRLQEQIINVRRRHVILLHVEVGNLRAAAPRRSCSA